MHRDRLWSGRPAAPAGKPFQAVVFDLFGTLVGIFQREDYQGHLAAMAAALGAPAADFGGLWEHETAEARVTGGFKSVEENLLFICGRLGLSPAPEQLAAAAAQRMSFYRPVIAKPRPDAVESLTRLKAAGLKLGLLSDCSCEAPLLWPDTPLAPLIDAPVFSCLAGRRKPDPLLYAQVCAALAVQPERCLYAGDGDGNELSGARAAGMSPVLLAVPGEGCAGAYRRSREEWTGPVAVSLEEIAKMALAA